MTLKIAWIDGGREPKAKPDPRYPDGIDLDISDGKKSCLVALPYPARRVGYYVVKCDICGTNTIVTTAGRPDDPRSIRLPCPARTDDAGGGNHADSQ